MRLGSSPSGAHRNVRGGSLATSDIHAGPTEGTTRAKYSRCPWCYPPDPRGIGQGAGAGINPCLSAQDARFCSCLTTVRTLSRPARRCSSASVGVGPARGGARSQQTPHTEDLFEAADRLRVPAGGCVFPGGTSPTLSEESRREASNCRPGFRTAIPPFRVVSASGPDGDPHCALYARVRGGREN
jgi:hypothetical protein